MTSDSGLSEKLRVLREGRIEPEDLYGLIHDLGEARFTSAEPDVARLLEHADPQIRYIAVSVLAFGWDMLHYQGVLEAISVADPDCNVRQIAVSGLGYLLRESRDARASKLLVEKLRSADEDGAVRFAAYEALLEIWLPSERLLPNFARLQSRLDDMSRNVKRTLALSRELGQAKLSGDSEKALAIAEELRILAEAWETSWQERVDWGAVAAIEHGEVPT